MTALLATRPPFSPAVPFAALRRVRTPRPARWLGRLLLLTFVLSPVALLLVPWQQTVSGRGQVVAYAPTERKQVVTALISGQVKKWYVVEGSQVKAGDPIADIDDNDPGLADRLENQKKFLSSRLTAAKEEVAELGAAEKAQQQALDAAVKAAQASEQAAGKLVDVAKQRKDNSEFARKFEEKRFGMHELLFRGRPKDRALKGSAEQDDQLSGLVSELDRDEAKVRADRATTDVKAAEAEVARADAALLTAGAQVLQARAVGQTAVATARSNLERAKQNQFTVERDIQEIDNRIERFKARFVKAPCDGVVHRVSANTGVGGQYVKEGDELVEIVPDTVDRVVEVYIDGVDAPLVAAHMEQTGKGPHVRLQFEGWPGVQFAGWPSVAIGTFGGRVRQIDPTDDGNGRFRILVEPEMMFEGDEWPVGLFLRQGNQAVGWVFLNRVTLGFELWRQFNGFPPVIAPKAPDKDKKDGSKPPKVKPGG